MPYDLDAMNLTYTLSWSDPILNQGDFLEIGYQAANFGSVRYSGPVSVRVFLSTNIAFGREDHVLVEYTHASTYSFFGLTATRFVPDDIAAGRYNLVMQIDPGNLIAEGNETNNVRFISDIVINRADLTTQTAADIFATHGKLAFMAKLAAAAYHLTEGETPVRGINQVNAAAEEIFASLAADLTLLDDSDVPALPRLGFQGPQFPVSGLRDGIYTNENAAALVARSADAVFLAFRGTNDNNGNMGAIALSPETPDGNHWTSKGNHYALFQPMLTALVDYMTTFGLTKLYVAGHSLGAAMVQAFMESHPAHPEITIRADAFASPGYGFGFGSDSRMTNLLIKGDPIAGAAFFNANSGDENTIFHNLTDQVLALRVFKEDADGNVALMTNKDKKGILHSVNFYSEFTKIMQANGIGDAALSGRALNGVDYDHVYINATLSTTVNSRLILSGASIAVGTGDDTITGTARSEILLGHTGNDLLKGDGGQDHILGGDDTDQMFGGGGTDWIEGGSGNDRLSGGSGRDTLTGGDGQDHFIFLHTDYFGTPGVDAVPVPNSLNDTINDFQAGIDKINLINIDPSLAPGNQAFVFLGRTAYTKTAGELRWGHVNGNTLVQGDMNGDGRSDFSITLIGLHMLQASDFVL